MYVSTYVWNENWFCYYFHVKCLMFVGQLFWTTFTKWFSIYFVYMYAVYMYVSMYACNFEVIFLKNFLFKHFCFVFGIKISDKEVRT